MTQRVLMGLSTTLSSSTDQEPAKRTSETDAVPQDGPVL